MKLLFFLLLFPFTVLAEGLNAGSDWEMVWPPNPASDQVTSYEVWCGTLPGQYSGSTLVTGTQIPLTALNLADGQTYCALKANNAFGTSPGFSGEVPFVYSSGPPLLGPPGIVGMPIVVPPQPQEL